MIHIRDKVVAMVVLVMNGRVLMVERKWFNCWLSSEDIGNVASRWSNKVYAFFLNSVYERWKMMELLYPNENGVGQRGRKGVKRTITTCLMGLKNLRVRL